MSDFELVALLCYLCVLSVVGWLGKKSECAPAINAGGVIYSEAAPSLSLCDFSVLPKRPCQQQTKLKSQGGGKFSKESLASDRPRLIHWL